MNDKNKILAGLLAIFLGGLGIHKFYLGYTTPGIITLLITLFGGALTFGVGGGVMLIISFIEGVIYLTMSDEKFNETYCINKKNWF